MNPVPARRQFLAGLMTVPVLAACNGTGSSRGGGSASAGAARLTLGLSYIPDIQFAPVYVAKEKGYFSDAGLDVTLRHHGAEEQLTGALTSGTEQVLYAGADEMMQARSQGVKVKNFGTLYQSYPVVAISRQDTQITRAAQLKGRTIGVPGRFGETWFGLLALLKQAGLTPQDVTVRTIGFTQQAALTTKKVDVVMGYANNEVIRLQRAGVPVHTLAVTGSLISIGLGALDTTVADRKADLAKIIPALRRAGQDVAQDPGAAVTLSKKYVPTLASPAQSAAALDTLKATLKIMGDPQRLGRQDAARWKEMSAFMVEQELVKSKVPAEQAYLSVSS